MEQRDFIYWLQGFLEISDPETISTEKVKIIKEHIALVLNKETKPVVFKTEPIFLNPANPFTNPNGTGNPPFIMPTVTC